MVQGNLNRSVAMLQKCPTGIDGFDEITGGGLPMGRPTRVCGSAGSGKTLFAMGFVVNGAIQFDEPGVFISFEESEIELAQNMASIGWDLPALSNEKKLFLDHIYIEKSEIQETGEYNLDGLFIRIETAVNAVNAQRIALDTLEALFSGFTNEAFLRAEIRRLFRWLKMKGLTAVITGEQGKHTLTRHGLEEYVSDCVVSLENQVIDRVATRRMRVIKYRGSGHGTNEYPFLLAETGVTVFPVTSLEMNYSVSLQRISSGVSRLDTMLGDKGYYRGSSVLVSGTAGTGKSSLGASFAAAACQRGERAIYFSFEEPPDQIIRNMGSIGIDLRSYVEQKALLFRSVRATTHGLETHLSIMIRQIAEIQPTVVVIDPISELSNIAGKKDAKEMLLRIIMYLKRSGITVLFTDLSHQGVLQESTQTAISSLMDTWILLRDIELNGERNRGLYILKSRGMKHSNQIREFLITSDGIQLKDVYVGPGGVLTGTARVIQEAADQTERLSRDQRVGRLRRVLQSKEKVMQNRIEELRGAFATEREELESIISEAEAREKDITADRVKMGQMRGQDEKGEVR